MKRIILFAAAACIAGGAAQAQTLNLKVEGLQAKGGQVLIAVQTRDQYQKPALVGGTILEGSAKGEAVLKFPLPRGEYAVTVLHDADSNSDMTLGADGRPSEGWATVNQANLRARPTFDQVKFSVAGDTSITLPMVYPAK